MTSTYSILFNLQVTHTYFKTGFSEGLIYNPSSDTKQLIDRYNFKLMLTDKGFQLYSFNNQTLEDFLKYIETTTGNTYFEFNAQVIDQVFSNYTDLPLDNPFGLSFDSKEHDIENNTTVLKQQFTESAQTINLFSVKIQLFF